MPLLHQPLDRTKTEHVAVVERVVWSDPDAEKIIVALADGFAAIGGGLEEQFAAGTKIRFLGRWQDSPKRGPQFHFSTFIPDVPPSRKGQIDYLVTYAPNVGRATAEKLCDQYGYEAVRTLRERPELVAGDGLMRLLDAQEAAAALAAVVKLERTKIDLFELFKGRGFPGKLVDASIAAWGARAPLAIRRNPFALLVRELPGAGFKRCDKLWSDLGLPAGALKRQMLCGWAALRDDSSGHTWQRGEKFVEAVKQAIPGRTDPVKAIRLGLRAGWLRKRRDADSHLWLAEAAKAIAEERVADRVRMLGGGKNLWPRDLPVSEADGDGLPSVHQRDTALAALASPFGILAGSPGTGKTHTLAFVLHALIEQYGADAVAVCAPTGKAAVRATQSLQRLGLPIKASTIHRLLEIGRNGHDGKGWGFLRNAANPLVQRFVILDEASMVDTTLLADLLDACSVPPWSLGEFNRSDDLPTRLTESLSPEGHQRRLDKFPMWPCSTGHEWVYVFHDASSGGLWKIGMSDDYERRHRELELEQNKPLEKICLIRTRYAHWLESYLHACFSTKRISGEWFRLDRNDVALIASFRPLPGTHVLLIGDPGQLAPVGHGAPLRDLIAAARGVAA